MKILKKRDVPVRGRVRPGELWDRYRKSVAVFLLFAGLGAIAQITGTGQGELTGNGALAREPPGKGDRETELVLSVPEIGREAAYVVKVPEQILTREERRDCFARAEQEAEDSFLGENVSLEEIRSPVLLRETFADGLVKGEWTFSDLTAVNIDGTLDQEEVGPEGKVVTATVTFTCEGERHEYSFPFRICPPLLDEEEKILAAVDGYFQESAEQEGTEVALPGEAAGYRLEWKEKKLPVAALFLCLGLLAGAAVEARGRSKKAEDRKAREDRLRLEYPEMVNKLALLLGAGMTVSAAWQRIVETYVSQKEGKGQAERPVYEEMRITLREIGDGVSERLAYERFGDRCGLREYRKFSSLLTQNLRKGTKGLTRLMEAEADAAFELRKNHAKKLGEEAGTKLLAPMLMSLAVVMIIVMVPAVMSFYG